MGFDAKPHLLRSVVRVREPPAWDGQVRARDAGDAQVGDQRQDRMVVRAGDQLRLTPVLHLAILR